MGFYTNIAKPLLFTLPPESATRLAHAALAPELLWRALGPLFQTRDRRLETDVAGTALPNPVGLAAGYDKDCRVLGSLASLGFGYMVGGTVVAQPREGNPRPRVLRRPSDDALLNSLGFPSQGLDAVVRRLKGRRTTDAPLLVSISGLSVEDISRCYRELQPLASGVELNISSPNTEGIRVFQEPQRLRELLSELLPQKRTPLFVKLPPFVDEAQRSGVLALVDVCLQSGADGVTAMNTLPVEEPRLAMGRGGLSGKPLLPHMLHMVREIRQRVGPGPVINACGGIASGEDALSALTAGANTVQLFTGLVYQGPGLIRSINRYLLRHMEREGIPSVDAIPRV